MIASGYGLNRAATLFFLVVQQNHGFVLVQSRSNQGACFRIHLPRHSGQTAHLTGDSESDSDRGHGETILLVEDEPAILTMGKAMLTRYGYRTIAVSTPGEALRIAEHHSGEIHLLITDVVMPGMNGRELAQRLLDLRPRLKCLFMSGYTADVIANRGILDEGVQFIPKPFSRKSLIRKVREVLDQS